MTSPAVELRGVQKSFGNTSVIRDINLTVVKGERHALIGPNGAGKSTLFNLISGYMIPTVGSILLKDEIVSGLPLIRSIVVVCLAAFRSPTSLQT